ncbi:MAG: hypothetical protein ACXW1R_08735 [Halobacteriota archaeon]
MRLIVLLGLLGVLAGCSSFGPSGITYSRSDIEKRAFIDRKSGEFGKLFKGLDGPILTGPDVGFMTASQRIELAWTVKLPDGPMAIPLSLRIAISGIPKLNAAKQGINLDDTRVEEFRMPSIPFLNMTDANMRQGSSLGSIPLLQFDPSELRHDDIVYEPTGISLGIFGLHVKLAPK